MANVEYAIYRGDSFQFIGTADECADRLGIKPRAVRRLATPTGKREFEARGIYTRALTAVRLDERDE